jgi:hypothetical protein
VRGSLSPWTVSTYRESTSKLSTEEAIASATAIIHPRELLLV